ncbi:MAG TPA: tRNA (adenosine(37)-N6)-threonylcarbamoyltransferase complex transferase subunit TsaD [Gemmatimonadetes bacterium]|nr:tRNA (adenosine(37)-N6)-threonylcarbamoyltransferase complex transferase subunit TsaD [Gemmatimonadota bacterium]HAT17292.1 tRNA (adenosine(37)-N6)-threonylcarbamoyltransferase complex transferase subunit TsaD [Gemmatimonadota bacterium]
MSDPLILGLETSCDETSAAVLKAPDTLKGHVIYSQDEHILYGGVVPEIAARAHIQRIDEVVDRALVEAGCTLSDIDAVAVTAGPGLIGALLVGVCWAKAAAFGLGRPLVAVHHMEAHLFAPSLENPDAVPPFVALLVSGGHTLLLHVPEWGTYHWLGQTRDDAAGEAFDKVARLLGMPYPGGPAIEAAASRGDEKRYRFPRPMLRRNQRPGDDDFYDFSFSGLKTAVVTVVREIEEDRPLEPERENVAASFQAAVVDVLTEKTMRAVEEMDCPRVLLGGGVAANGRLREALATRLEPDGVLLNASPRLSLDNGAMVARAGAFRLGRGEIASLDASPDPNLPFPGLLKTFA